MKKILLSILVLAIAGCSSKPKEEESAATEDLSYSSGASGSHQDSNKHSSREDSVPKVTTSRSDASSLDQAIQDGSDDNIQRVAQGVLAKNQNDIPALLALGVVHYKRSQWVGALMMFDKVIKLDPRNLGARNNRALVYLSQHEVRDAIKEFKKVIEADPTNATAAANLGAIYLENKDYQKAFIAMDIAYQRMSRDPKVLNNYGIALTGAGRFKEARDAYQRALDKSPGSKEVMLNYAILLIDHLKQFSQGLELVNKLKFLGLSPEVKNRINLLENNAKAGLK